MKRAFKIVGAVLVAGILFPFLGIYFLGIYIEEIFRVFFLRLRATIRR